MGGKKKGGGKGKKTAVIPEEDNSTEIFKKIYGKKANEMEITKCPQIIEKLGLWEEDNNDVPTKFHIWSELGWAGTRCLMDSLREANYQHCQSIRLWKTFCEDEGVRAVCQYLETGKNVLFIELLDNKITPLGCEFISRVMHPSKQPQIQILKLDHNHFGSQGMINLSEGIAMNPTLKYLSLTYCSIDERGADALFEILIYTRSAIEEINLSGNELKNEGICTVLQGAAIAKSLKKITLSDNQFDDDTERDPVNDVIRKLSFTISKNKKLVKYDLKFNSISTEGVDKIREIIENPEEGGHVTEIEVPERVEKEAYDKLKAALANNKPKKGGKGKKGKGKKKKKA